MVPLTTLPELGTFSVLSASTWLLIHLYVRTNGPIPGTRAVIKANSWFYATMSLLMLIATLTTTTTPNNTDDDDNKAFPVRYTYHVSKFYEFLDILLVAASGGHIGLHFGFHHLTTPYLTFFRFLNNPAGGSWRVFAALNTFHHVLMYAYFGGAQVVRPFVPWTGGLQLIASVAVDVVVVWERYGGGGGGGGDIWPYVFSACLVGTYFGLYLRDLRMGKV
ncbi:uncharacterized protein BJX67DRAFT_384930 [Aspergillus lucknowensis]|uniref:Very-long-chain 3-oxoacyl-CoA synthase n=1 Tax=Aspergillus lucknowensis TaxID=176173 RepID=A0ABR4LF68_9EURO